MDPELEMEAQLWAYIDGITTEAERSAIERLLAENAAWRSRHAALLETHLLLQQTELEEPSMRFTQNVMEALAAAQIVPASRRYLNNRVIGGIGLFFAALLLFVLTVAIKEGGADSGANGTPFSFNLKAVFGSNFVSLVLMGNILLGLLLLDRVLSARRGERIAKNHL